MSGRGWAIIGLVALAAGCGSDGSDTDGSSGAGGKGAGGAGAAGASAGTGAASAGSAGNPSPVMALGTVGTGPVFCFGVSGDSCPAGSVCCVRFPAASNTCENSYAACADGQPLGCDDPSDCAGQKCCSKPVPGVGVAAYYGSGCKASCDPTSDRIICAVDADCNETGACMQSAASFKACF